MTIRPATPDDAEAIAQVHVQAWRTTYRGLMPDAVLDALDVNQRAQRWRDIFANREPRTAVLVAEDAAGRVVGFTSGGPGRDADLDPAYDGELYAIYVLQDHQRGGLGRALMAALVERLRAEGFCAMFLWVLDGNQARRFYEAMGGQLIGQKVYDMEGAQLDKLAFGWPDLGVGPLRGP